MNFCSQCGARVELRIPEGDTHARHVCAVCGNIHYSNPKLVVGCIAEWNGSLLMCRRAIEPRRGLWTLPAGFMENGESTPQAAMRETLEEANADVQIDGLFSLIDVPYISQVHLFYRGHVRGGTHSPGPESLETCLFAEAELPWETLAFRSVEFTLRAYLHDRAIDCFRLHTTSLAAVRAS